MITHQPEQKLANLISDTPMDTKIVGNGNDTGLKFGFRFSW